VKQECWTLTSAVMSLCLQALKKKDLLYYTNFHFELISTNNDSTTNMCLLGRSLLHKSVFISLLFLSLLFFFFFLVRLFLFLLYPPLTSQFWFSTCGDFRTEKCCLQGRTSKKNKIKKSLIMVLYFYFRFLISFSCTYVTRLKLLYAYISHKPI